MTRVSATNSVLLLLREQLDRAARAKAKDVVRTAPRQMGPRQRLEALAAAKTLSDEELESAAVRLVLGDRLGPEILAEPGFELVVRDVVRMIGDTPEGQALLAAAKQQVLGG